MATEIFCKDCPEAVSNILVGGAITGLVALGILIATIIILGIYIYFAFAWKTIADKLRYKKSWLAWIPFANLAMILQIGNSTGLGFF